MTEQSDNALLDAFQAGDNEAFNAIIERYSSPVFRLAYKFTRNPKDAEDVSQDTFLKAYENLIKHPKSELNLKPWLMTICVNLCRNLAKKKKSFNFSDMTTDEDEREFESMIEDSGPGTHERIQSKEEAGIVREAIEKLPEKYQIILQMRYTEDLSYQEISDILQLPMSTVKVHLNRAKSKLKVILEAQIYSKK
ncbi:RNA polymerase sigma factor [Patescibacteria group bacterium]|nr:RNA polymerase sigma factor [Patescibacteria group bacterium]